MTDAIITVKHLKTYFHTFQGTARAVDDISFRLFKGETLGIVGESGCGKSVTAQSIMRLIPEPPGRIEGGAVEFDGQDVLKLSQSQMRNIRGNCISMIFQEPMTALNPVYTVGNQIAEMFVRHMGLNKRQAMKKAVLMLDKVQIPAPEIRVLEYPHQLSGGMRQRVMIAMALACEPQVLIADEPTTAIDVTIQAQIIELMLKLNKELGTAIIMITHDLAVVSEMAQRVIVMYAGKIVEQGTTRAVFKHAAHPYTQGLLKSVPILGKRGLSGRQRLMEIKGIVPGPYHLSEGCSFFPRCGKAMHKCSYEKPKLVSLETGDAGHKVCCRLYEGVD